MTLLFVSVLAPDGATGTAGECVAKCPVGALALADAVPLREALHADRRGHQIVSANLGSEDLKIARPTTNIASATTTLSAI